MPTVRVPSVLRRYSAGEAEVRVDGVTVRAALGALFQRHPDLRPRVLDAAGGLFPYLVLFRNDEALDRATALATKLTPSDVLEIVGAAEGG